MNAAAITRQPLTAVKIGNSRSDRTADWSHPGSRTRNQHEAVLAQFRRHPAAWIAGTPFGSDRPGQKFRCGFNVSYFDLEGRYCGFWVRPDGRVVDFMREPASEVMAAEALQTVSKFGLFRGGE